MKIKILCICLFAGLIAANASTPDKEQIIQNVQILNYISSLSEKIKTERKNRYELQNLRDEIYNELVPAAIDKRTNTELNEYLEKIKEFTLISRQRDRVKLIIDNEKAKAFNKAIPDPQYMIASVLSSKNPYMAALSIGTMIMNSVVSYNTAMADADMEELKMNWELEDRDYVAFEDQSKSAWNYMNDLARKYNLSKGLTLSEKSIQKFFAYKKEISLERRIRELENPEVKKIYVDALYKPYFLLLADTYYELKKWRECVAAYQEYEKLQSALFRREDYEATKILPKVIEAAKAYMSVPDFILFAKEYNEKLKVASTDEDWETRYFVALNYIVLAGLDNENAHDYFDLALDQLVNNISKLSIRQDSLLASYILPVDETIPKDITKDEKKVHEKMIKLEKKARKTQKIPLDEALFTNMEMAHAISKQDAALRKKWKNALPLVNNSVVNVLLRKKYGLEYNIASNVSFKKKSLIMPTAYLDSDTKITISVEPFDMPKYSLKDVKFEVKKVHRPDEDDLIMDKNNKDFIKQIDLFTTEISLNLKSFKIDFDKVKKVEIVLQSYGEKVGFTFINEDDEFIFKN